MSYPARDETQTRRPGLRAGCQLRHAGRWLRLRGIARFALWICPAGLPMGVRASMRLHVVRAQGTPSRLERKLE